MTAALKTLRDEIEACRRCPRLVAHRELVAQTRRRAYATETYWGRPIAGFGDPDAWLLIVGLAPGAHGANRTGRAFTGDRSGDFLFRALHAAGIASQAEARSRDDGLTLRGAFITMPVRCVPPDNLPSRAEIEACRPFLSREIASLTNVRVVLALGAVAWAATSAHFGVPAARFAHGLTVEHEGLSFFASYHVSQQNTQTGRLTESAFAGLLARCRASLPKAQNRAHGRSG